jgi:hypothetical protein
MRREKRRRNTKGSGVVGCGASEAFQTLSVLSVPRMFMVAVGTSSNSNLGKLSMFTSMLNSTLGR